MPPTTLPPLAYPGLPLAPSTAYRPGPGTHLHTPTTGGPTQIIASLAGRPTILPAKPSPNTTTTTTSPKSLPSTALPTLTIPRPRPSRAHAPIIPSANISNTIALPRVGSVILGVVRRVRSRQVEVGICVVYEGGEREGGGGGEEGYGEGVVCGEEWPAVLRKEDVRATEKEKVVCAEGFRVGDVVRGVVISLGDQTNYYLTTAKNELGVIMARSEAGNLMVPVSWREFRDEETGGRESRKVAKPF
ncbi:exosome 3'-_5 exonuclease subunit ski4 (Csl4) [Lecanora helva]